LSGNKYNKTKYRQQTDDGNYIMGSETNSIVGDVSGNHIAIPGINDLWVVQIKKGTVLTFEIASGLNTSPV
jgi:hypothetical protein